jgi:hypothetical protein
VAVTATLFSGDGRAVEPGSDYMGGGIVECHG